MLNRLRHLMRVDQTAAKLYKPTVVHRLRYADDVVSHSLFVLDLKQIQQNSKLFLSKTAHF